VVEVLDTNVLVFANGQDGDDDCSFKASALLADIQPEDVAVDVGGEIFSEYGRCVNSQVQNKVGPFLWALYNVARRVPITPDAEGSYSEFPTHLELAEFPRKDRKFVAVALKAGDHRLSAASDYRAWGHHETALVAAGINLNFICPHLMRLKDADAARRSN